MKAFDECVICRFWTSSLKKAKDGNLYCQIHYPREAERDRCLRRAKKGIKWLEEFRSMKESHPV